MDKLHFRIFISAVSNIQGDTIMGTNLGKIIEPKTIEMDDLRGKVVVVDAHNILYQFLTVIRGRDGILLKNQKGQVTSHLLGLLPRVTNWLTAGLRPAFVFDGSPPDLKMGIIEERYRKRRDALRKFEDAKAAGNIDDMRKYGIRSAHLTDEILNSSMELLTDMGVPFIEAPSEADAQMAHMTAVGDAYAAVTQDYDPLLHGAERLVRNLSKSQRSRKGLQLVELVDVLESLSLSREELIALAIMMGTDYKPGGVYGIGPKRGQKLLKNYDVEEAFERANVDFNWQQIMDIFLDMPVTDDYELEWKVPDASELRKTLVSHFGFSEKRADKRVPQIMTAQKNNKDT
jgi:flap endonuclease-1